MKCIFLRCGLVGALLLGGALGIAGQQAAKHAIAFDDLIKLHRIAEPQVSPDGKWVAYTVATPDMEANRNASNIWMVPTTGGSAIQLSQSGHDSSTVCSHDGKPLALLSSRAAHAQVYVTPTPGREAHTLTR